MPDRVQMHRRPGGWRADHPDAVIVARPTLWGNPWRPGKPATFWLPDFPVADAPIGCELTAEGVVALYRRLLTRGPDPLNMALPATLSPLGRRRVRDSLRAHEARITARLPELRGRDLACWCPPGSPCHADVLLELANA